MIMACATRPSRGFTRADSLPSVMTSGCGNSTLSTPAGFKAPSKAPTIKTANSLSRDLWFPTFQSGGAFQPLPGLFLSVVTQSTSVSLRETRLSAESIRRRTLSSSALLSRRTGISMSPAGTLTSELYK
jgi:hypothetical protein